MPGIKQIRNKLNRHSQKILWLFIIGYCVTVSVLLIGKYTSYGYNAIDLGIYNQVFYNSAHGHLFQFSVHPHLYLGDHFELFILALLPIYALAQSPITLLILQIIAIALAAWPLYRIAKQWLNNELSLFIALAWLFNPFILNANFFEFHLLPFAVVLLCWTFYFYLKNNFYAFFIFSLLSLLVREDVAFVICMFGILALIERKKIKWIIAPIVMSAIWFFGAFQLTSYFNHSGSYKFLALYGWLGSTPKEILLTALGKPWLVVKQLISFNNIFLLLGLLVPLVGLPILKPKYLLLALLVTFQLLLAGLGTAVVLQTHYAALVWPFLFIAAGAALADLQTEKQLRHPLKAFIIREKTIFSAVLIVAVLYSFLTFSPLLPTIRAAIHANSQREFVAAKKQATSLIKPTDSVAAGFSFLPQLANREKLYSLHYAFLGKKQFSDEPYLLPTDTNKLVVDFNDFLFYYFQAQSIGVYKEQYAGGAERLNQFIATNKFCLRTIADDIAVYEKDCQSDIQLVEKIDGAGNDMQQADIKLDKLFTFVSWEKNTVAGSPSLNTLPLSFYWRADQQLMADYQLELLIKNEKNKVVYQKYYPLGYGLYPTRSWVPSQIMKTNYWFIVPKKLLDTAKYRLSVQVVELTGYMTLDGQRSVVPMITRQKNIGPAIRIDYSTR